MARTIVVVNLVLVEDVVDGVKEKVLIFVDRGDVCGRSDKKIVHRSQEDKY